MLNPDRVEAAIDLQDKSYKLLKWVNSRLQSDTLAFNVAHKAMSAAEAAEEWIGRHWANLPLETKPAKEQLSSFARLFASYLTTSFELREDPRPILVLDCGCLCNYCSYLAAGTHLKTKKVNKKAKENARELKRVYLQELASDLALEPAAASLDDLMDDPALSEQIALATYATELIRRTEFASQGLGVLALWREIAWEGSSPRKKFRLNSKKILAAEARVREALQAAA